MFVKRAFDRYVIQRLHYCQLYINFTITGFDIQNRWKLFFTDLNNNITDYLCTGVQYNIDRTQILIEPCFINNYGLPRVARWWSWPPVAVRS